MTLTEAAFWTKRFGVIALVVIGVILVIFAILFTSSKQTLPPQYLTANFACTETKDEFLQNQLTIPSLEVKPDSEMVYQLNTDTGKINQLPRIINVYKYINLGQSLSSQGDAKVLAKKLGFDPDKIVRKGTTDYIWVDNTTKRSLDIKARDLNFELKTDLDLIREINKTEDLPTQTEAISLASNALRTLGILNESFTKVQPTVHLIDINPDGSFTEAESLIEAELIKVDFFRKVPMISIASNLQGAKDMVGSLTKSNLTYDTTDEIINDERIEVYNFSTLLTYQDPVDSNITVYVGPKNENNKTLTNIYQVEFNTWNINETACGTYELLPPSIALEKIQNGEGSLVYLNYAQDEIIDYVPQTIKSLSVDDIYITYYESPNEQTFLQPVYMVEGQARLKDGTSADFHIYYPAINYGIVQDKIDLPEPVIEEKSNSFF